MLFFNSPSCDKRAVFVVFFNSPLCLQGGVAVSRGGLLVIVSSPSEALLVLRLSSPFGKGTVVAVFFYTSSTIRGGAIYGGGVREYVFYFPTPSLSGLVCSALLWETKVSVVANNAHPRCPSYLRGRVVRIIFLSQLKSSECCLQHTP